MSHRRDSTISFIGLMIANICYFIIGVIISRILGPSGKGAWAIILLIIDYIALVSNLGIDAASIYYLGKEQDKKDQIFSFILYAWLGLAMISILISIPAIVFCGEKILTRGEFNLWLALGAAAIAPLFLGLRLLNSYFQGCLQIFQYNFFIIAQLFVQIIGLFIFLIVLRLDIWGVFISHVLSILFVDGLILLLIYKEGIKISFKKGKRISKKMISYGIKGYLGNMIQFINYKIDLFLVNLLLGISATGIYSVAVNLSNMCWFFSYAISISLFPRVSSGLADNKKLISKSVKVCFLLTSLAAIFLTIIAKPFLARVYGKEFVSAAEAIYFLLPGIVIFVYGRIVANYFSGNGRPLINSAISLASLAVNIPLNLILIPQIGIRGAALATTVAYSVTSFISYFLFKLYPIDVNHKNNKYSFYRAILKKLSPAEI